MGVLPDKLIQCPHCSEILRVSVVNYNGARGLRKWVDGYIQYPFLTESPEFCGCPKCGKRFWTGEAPFLGSFSFSGRIAPSKSWEEAPYVRDLAISDLLEVLKNGDIKRKPVGFEIYLRLLALHKFNHRRRSEKLYTDPELLIEEDYPAGGTRILSKPLCRSLEELILILSANNGIGYEDSRPYFLFLKAESEREIGAFRDSEKTIALLVRYGTLSSAGEALKYLAKNRLSGIYRLPE